MEKIRLKQAVVVEGKYDKIKLSSFIDGVIICTNGFRVFKDRKTADLIRYYAKNSGIIILTDSDSAGFRIRGHIKGSRGQDHKPLYSGYIRQGKAKDQSIKGGKAGSRGYRRRTFKRYF